MLTIFKTVVNGLLGKLGKLDLKQQKKIINIFTFKFSFKSIELTYDYIVAIMIAFYYACAFDCYNVKVGCV